MEETMENKDLKIIETKKIINAINRVDGFHLDLLATDAVVDGEAIKYLPVGYKKAWARLVFPNYKMLYPVREIIGKHAHVIARFYQEKTDAEDQYIGEGEAFVMINADKLEEVAANEALMIAKGSAASKALTEAGFGLQFYMEDIDKKLLSRPEIRTDTIAIDNLKEHVKEKLIRDEVPEVSDNFPMNAPEEDKEKEGEEKGKKKRGRPRKKAQDTVTQETPQEESHVANDSFAVESVIDIEPLVPIVEEKQVEKMEEELPFQEKEPETFSSMYGAIGPEEGSFVDASETDEEIPFESPNLMDLIGFNPNEEKEQTQDPVQKTEPVISESVETNMALEDAIEVKIDFGKHSGKSLGDLCAEGLQKDIIWIRDSYAGENEMLKIAAKIICNNMSF